MSTKTFVNGQENGVIAFFNDTEPCAVYVDGERQDNISYVPQEVTGETSVSYSSEYKKNILNLTIEGNTETNDVIAEIPTTYVGNGNTQTNMIVSSSPISLPSSGEWELVFNYSGDAGANFEVDIAYSQVDLFSYSGTRKLLYPFAEKVTVNQPFYIGVSDPTQQYLSTENQPTFWNALIASGLTMRTYKNAGDTPIKCVLKTNDEDYQQVEYIESTGTQYIDTLFKANQNTRIVVDFEIKEIFASFVFGARTSAGSRAYTLNIGGTPIQFVSSFGSSGNKAIEVVYTTLRYKVDKNKNVLDFYVGTQKDKTITFTNTTFTTQGNVNLFACNQAGSNGYLPSKMRLYSCQMYDNGTLIRDFIPCYRKSDNVAGLFDVVNSVFYENQGTGEFEKGANVGTSNTLKKVEVEIPSSVTVDGQEIDLKFGTGEKLIVDMAQKSNKIIYINSDNPSGYNLTQTELGQALLNLVNSTQNATNIIEIASTPSVSNLSVNYAKWGGIPNANNT